MDFIEKPKIRMDHWAKHNKDHLGEYETFAHELETADKVESARYIREMAALTAQGNDLLRWAIRALE